MTFIDYCRNAAEQIWRAYEHHPWIEALAAGELTVQQFAFFQLDDCAHVADFNRTLALGIAKAPVGHPWAAYAAHIIDDMSTVGELEEKQAILADLGFVAPLRNDRWSCSPAREGYVNHLVRVGYEGTFAEVAAALYPCAMFASVIGTRFTDVTIPGPAAFRRWADMYTRRTRHQMRDHHAAVVEEAAEGLDAGGRDRLLQLYTRSLHHQIRVFDAAWTLQGQWPAGAESHAQHVIGAVAAPSP